MHQSVLLEEAIKGLAVTSQDTVLDATIGGAGHFAALLQQLGPNGTLIGIDADNEAVMRAQKKLESIAEERAGYELPQVHLIENNFRNLASLLEELGIKHLNASLFDLGWSSFHLSRGRGFSFQTDEPLHMTYGDPEVQQTAEDVVNGLPEEELANLIYTLGEEQFSRRIAKAIVDIRKKHRITTTAELVNAINAAVPVWYQQRRINSATKTFQALRMYVNDELGALSEGLTAALEHTAPEGRIAVITFHSIEDRVVKNLFRDEVQKGTGVLVYKKPIIPSVSEISRNPRARSAKLRIFERIAY